MGQEFWQNYKTLYVEQASAELTHQERLQVHGNALLKLQYYGAHDQMLLIQNQSASYLNFSLSAHLFSVGRTEQISSILKKH